MRSRPRSAALSDDQLRACTEIFRQRLRDGADLDDLIPEAFATVREAAKRAIGQRHFDVQMIGGMVLHEGRIAEMKTGEGKTLVATLAVYLNALAGKGVHVVTVNDYLARRDAAWMGAIYKFLGLSVGCILHDLSDPQRREQYAADVTYGTNNEFGFDYLRDNMKYAASEMVQRGHHFAIVDEVDSILIDEARTPLIISGPLDDRSELYNKVDTFIPKLEKGDYELDEKTRIVSLTEGGNEKIERLLAAADMLKGDLLYDIENVSLVHHVQQALRAHTLFQRDRDYIVKDDEVIIIDEFTGRMMQGRRYSEGLHQALEAKEHVSVQPENQTLATITFQNYFRLYGKLAGMTGTAATEAEEFMDIYGLDVVEVPTNMDMIRNDEDDEVYRTAQEKYRAIIALIKEAQKLGQPMLVGTTSIEKSEILSELLKKDKVPHQVLNARYHEQEAKIIAQAGVPGSVTIATNMAGRGTDIQLGGNPDMLIADWIAAETEKGKEPTSEAITARRKEIATEVTKKKEKALKAGGLYVIGTERHESRRIDNQLRGRSGRQGDPGRSRFFLSLEDDLMRIFGSQRMDGMLGALGLKEDEAIVHPWINKALEKAQAKVEARNFDIRKNLLKYDNVMNDQRKAIFEQRRELDRRRPLRHHRRHAPPRDRRSRHREHPRQVLCRAVGHGDVAAEHARHLRHRRAARRVGCRGRDRRGRDPRAADQGRDERFAKKAADFGPAIMRQIETRGPAPDARRAMARASRHARASPPGDRLARLRPARSAERVQERELHAVRAHAGAVARSGHRPADAYRTRQAGGRTAARAGRAAADGGPSPRSADRRGRVRA